MPTVTMLELRLIVQSTPSTRTSRHFGFGGIALMTRRRKLEYKTRNILRCAPRARTRRVYGVAYLPPRAASDALLTAPRVDPFKVKSAL